MIVFAADLHLNPLIWQDMPLLTYDSYRPLTQITDYCVEHMVSALFLGGDIFDKPRPDSQSVAVFLTEMEKLAAAGVKVYAVQGQHEMADPPWACLSEHVQCIGDGRLVEIEDEGVTITVCGFDNTSAEVMKESVKAMDPAPDILVIHQLVKQLVPFEGAWDFDLKWVPKKTKLVLGGDYHKHCHEGKLWYAGSTHMRNIDERGEHRFLQVVPGVKRVTKGKGKKSKEVVEWDGKFTVDTLPIRTRAVIECLVNDESHIDIALATITEHKPDEHWDDEELVPLVYLKYNPQVDGALSRVTEVCKEKGYFLRTKTTVGSVEVVEDVPQLGAVTLEECMARVVDREKEPEFFSFALALVTGDHRAALDAAKVQFGLVKENN